LASKGVHPDVITYTTLLTAFGGGLVLLISGNQILFGVLVFLTGLLDGVDGAVARLGGHASPAGPFTDSVVDKAAEGLILLFVALRYQDAELLHVAVPIWCFICLFGWLMTSYARARAEVLGVRDLDVGLGARSERLFTLFLSSVLQYLTWGLVIVTVMGVCTAAYRTLHYSREILRNNT